MQQTVVQTPIRATVEFSLYDNSWYKPGGTIKRAIWFIINIVFFNNKFAVFSPLKVALLRLFGASVGKGVVIKPSVNIKYPWMLSIGDHCWIGENVWIDNVAQVVIGRNVCISQGAYILCGNHDFTTVGFDLIVKPITLEDGVWIGARSTVCPGVTCKSHSILTVQSVATKNLNDYTIYQGIPAVAVKSRIIR
ncbi:WcaF family extracellular polysaccharide biosynthesis acetyltransferase [Aridibaculum aurantiacum]|uniref:WcaF family extracellular polysaccharide biosynthesis acetyltransferase n=1 Tax=Aridibaculum aurantiacum TaxID=2810307 RepID=UPI001A96020A|nr:WcaF family extracellular polysaccharide biosynthesis acetyltransferase [Aridibaculum aurantiacum]